MKQAESYTTAENNHRRIEVTVEQVIYSDGSPAVIVSINKYSKGMSSTTLQEDGTYTKPDQIEVLSNNPTVRGATAYRFPAPTPGAAVGQWSDKILSGGNTMHNIPRNLTPNNDPDTYMDYKAWSGRFHEVYSRS